MMRVALKGRTSMKNLPLTYAYNGFLVGIVVEWQECCIVLSGVCVRG